MVSHGNRVSFDDAIAISPNNVVTNGPFGEIKETIGGYMIIRAEAADSAAEFAKGSCVLQGEVNSPEVGKIARYKSLKLNITKVSNDMEAFLLWV